MTEYAAAALRARQACDRAVGWLLQHLESNGRPHGAELGNGWSRLPWTLALAGEGAAGHQVLQWACGNGLSREGGLSPGPARGTGRFGAYPLGHLAMGALLLERHDVAAGLFKVLGRMQTPSGGFPIDPFGGEAHDLCDLLSAAQVGIAALLGGQHEIVDGVYRWIARCYASQPELPHRLYVAMRDDALLRTPPAGLEWVLVVDFSQPRQAYFYPGIAAVFLAGFALQRAHQEAIRIGRGLLALNLSGNPAQYEDLASVQACKFGWGAAAMQIADPTADYAAPLVRMVDWFIARQRQDGAWTPSTFMSPKPSIVELMTKTAEHAMEIHAVAVALSALAAR